MSNINNNTFIDALMQWNKAHPENSLVSDKPEDLKIAGLGQTIFASYQTDKWSFKKLGRIGKILRWLHLWHGDTRLKECRGLEKLKNTFLAQSVKEAITQLNVPQGNYWLKNDVRLHTREALDEIELNSLCFAFINKKCSELEDWDLAKIFPERKLTASKIQELTVNKLLDLSPEDYFAVIDLISGEQAIQILESQTHETRKMGLYFFSKNLADAFASKQRELSEAPIDDKVQLAAKEFFSTCKKYPLEEFKHFQSQSCYEKLDKQRMSGSTTLTNTSIEESVRKWKQLNQKYLSNGLEKPLTSEFLMTINTALRIEPKIYENPFSVKFRKEYRTSHVEVSSPERNLYYLPGRSVKKEIDLFIEWFNQQLDACDQNKQNPILLAASAYQRFISIHPFIDGNGRTGRFLADLVLRRFDLLPAAWEVKDIVVALFPVGDMKNQSNPQKVVEGLLEALKQSYKIT